MNRVASGLMTVPLTNEGGKDACQLTKTSLTKEIGHTVPSTKEKSALNVVFPTVHVTKHVVKSSPALGGGGGR